MNVSLNACFIIELANTGCISNSIFGHIGFQYIFEMYSFSIQSRCTLEDLFYFAS
eukprot:c29147_g1_i1 orf=1-162(-)